MSGSSYLIPNAQIIPFLTGSKKIHIVLMIFATVVAGSKVVFHINHTCHIINSHSEIWMKL